MGQAKRRGSYEERRALAIVRRTEEARAALEAAKAEWDALPEEQRRAETLRQNRGIGKGRAVTSLAIAAMLA